VGRDLRDRGGSISLSWFMADPIPAPSDPGDEPKTDRVRNAVEAARRYLLSIQNPDGHWCAELEGDTILESEYVLTMQFLGRTGEARVRKAAEYLRRQQLPAGGWANYPGGRPDVSTSVKAYFVLKIVGDDPSAPHMTKARELIRSLGGVEACNSFTKIYLAIFGQCSWSRCPAVPPELVLLPDWVPFNIYRMSSWSRTIVVPLSVLWAKKPYCPVPPGAEIPELHVPHFRPRRARTARERFWRGVFTTADVLLGGIEALGLTPFRKRALASCESWIHERLFRSDGLGAIFPPIVNTIFAFRSLGYAPDDPRLVAQVHELERFEIEDEETLRVQPCFSPVWDTALAAVTLSASGVAATDPSLRRAAAWLLEREVRHPGDWRKTNPDGPVGGWYFEYANECYPDTDDTAEVLTALSGVRFAEAPDEARRLAAIERGQGWLLSMQNRDGGWGAFDKECDLTVLTYIPFADHNAMLDPSCEDITGRALEALHDIGVPAGHPAVRAAVSFLDATQEPDGTWYGRWGVNYLYGTWLALRGLAHAGVDLGQPRYQRAAAWLRARQNADGGWGELPRSYDEPSTKGCGPSTAAQTAWVLMSLFALGEERSEAALRGVSYLLREQQYDGSWRDAHWTGTGFPKVFYLRYHLYATFFPLWALSLYGQGGSPRSRGAGRLAGVRSVRRHAAG
jgi:squalene-hopene/tetraprenyl-beta-curcumene cyclase